MAAVKYTKPSDKNANAHLKSGLGCCWCSPLYCDFPDCIGCECVQAFLCCDQRSKCSIFELTVSQTCFKSFTGMKGIGSCCCMITACAIPCDEEVPFTLGICGLMCASGVTTATTVNAAAAGAVNGGKAVGSAIHGGMAGQDASAMAPHAPQQPQMMYAVQPPQPQLVYAVPQQPQMVYAVPPQPQYMHKN